MGPIDVINRQIRHYWEQAGIAHYNPATKLAKREEVEAARDAMILGDQTLHGMIMVQLVHDPLYYSDHRLAGTERIVTGNWAHVREALKEAKLEQQMLLLDPVKLAELVHKSLTTRHGDRMVTVRGNAADWVPRSKWPYLRRVRDLVRSDIENTLDVQDAGISLAQDARKVTKTLDRAAAKANSSLWLNGATLGQIF